MFAELLKEQTGLFFIFFIFCIKSFCTTVEYAVTVFSVLKYSFGWTLCLHSKALRDRYIIFIFFPRNLIRNPHQTWTRTAYWFLLLFSGRKNLTWMLHWWYLQCCHVTIWPVWLKYTKNKVSVRLAPASRIKLTEVERLIMHLAF